MQDAIIEIDYGGELLVELREQMKLAPESSAQVILAVYFSGTNA